LCLSSCQSFFRPFVVFIFRATSFLTYRVIAAAEKKIEIILKGDFSFQEGPEYFYVVESVED